EILQARTPGNNSPPAPPAPAVNERIDVAPKVGTVSLSNENGEVSFKYQTAIGEHLDEFSFASESQNRVWHCTVKVFQKDAGRVNPDHEAVSVAGSASRAAAAQAALRAVS